MTPQPSEQPPRTSLDALRRIRDLCDLSIEEMRSQHGSKHRVLMAVIPAIAEAAIEAAAPDPVATPPAEALRLLRELIEAGDNVIPTAGMSEPGDGDWRRFSEATHEARRYLAATEEGT